MFLPKLGKCVKGTVQCVIADNLGAHSIAGFIETFSSGHICRFCTAFKSEIQTEQADSGSFTARTEDLHADHLKNTEESLNSFCGVKKRCVLSEKLSHFKVTTGFPPDLVHDVFEGIVPVEIALCLSVFTSKEYFTLGYLNESILHFPFKPQVCHFGTFWHTMCHLTFQVPVRKTNCVSLIHHSGYSFHPNTTISVVQDCGRAGNSKTCLFSTFHSNLFSLSLQDADADVRRECVLKLLIIYQGECVEDLTKEYMVCPIQA